MSYGVKGFRFYLPVVVEGQSWSQTCDSFIGWSFYLHSCGEGSPLKTQLNGDLLTFPFCGDFIETSLPTIFIWKCCKGKVENSDDWHQEWFLEDCPKQPGHCFGKRHFFFSGKSQWFEHRKQNPTYFHSVGVAAQFSNPLQMKPKLRLH